ncbi:hypothetical protein [Salinibius halmophilus]|uniref:hypothetical protein n=1 Tax=Salinibius halmophilus TaxID=1853216 RepID=UPI000E672F0A|nr:hypothetical protein [Salinibius halmophilus]
MAKFFLLAILNVFLIGLLHASEQLSVAQTKQYYTVVKPGGSVADQTRFMLLEAYLSIGIDPKFVDIPVARAEREVNGVHFNALAEASSRNDYANMLRIPVPLGTRELRLFALGDSRPESKHLTEQDVIGYVKGDLEAQWWLSHQPANVVTAPSTFHLLNMLDAGRIDYAAAQSEDFFSAIPGSPIYRNISSSVPVWRWQVFHYIHLNHAELAEALSIELVRASKAAQR